MATLFPSSLDGARVTEGEERVFSFLKQVLTPHASHWGWFQPVIQPREGGRREPDLVLLGPEYGILILEVKDWSRDTVLSGGLRRLTVRGPDGAQARRIHPEEQARTYAMVLREQLQRTPGLVHGAGAFEGKLRLPVNHGVVAPNLTRKDLDAWRGRGVPLMPEKWITRESLDHGDEEGRRRFLKSVDRVLDVKFNFLLDDALRHRVRTVIQPQLHFLDPREIDAEPAPGAPEAELPDDAARPPESERKARADTSRVTRVPLPASEGFFLDRKQERMARGLASPRTLVYGPAGSGKTVFLAARARYWLDQRPDARILFTCYNASLASHIKTQFALRQVAPDGDRVTVMHYHDLCRRILDMGQDFHEQPPDFYRRLEPQVLQEMARRDDVATYDLILVDEGQDFTRRMFEVLVRLAAPGGEITAVCDPAQDIYQRWDIGNLDSLGDYAVERLSDCYRNTAPIFDLALAVLAPETREAMGLNRLDMTRPEDLQRTGPTPAVELLDGLDALVTLLVDLAAEFDAQGRPLSDLAVLYPNRHGIPNFEGRLKHSRWGVAGDPRYQNPTGEDDIDRADRETGTLRPLPQGDDEPRHAAGHFAEALEKELLARNIPSEWVARNFATKAAYDISRPRLTISTIHSAKGMDFHTVVLLGSDTLAWKDEKPDPESAALLFTGITRARERLIVAGFLDRGWFAQLGSLVRAD